jgi:hypothetical protein
MPAADLLNLTALGLGLTLQDSSVREIRQPNA